MRILLDESLPRPLARLLPEHDVHTVAAMGWSGTMNRIESLRLLIPALLRTLETLPPHRFVRVSG